MPKSPKTPSGPEGKTPVFTYSGKAPTSTPIVARLNGAKALRTGQRSVPVRRLNIPGKGRGK
jgi:hypothetical protein